MSKKSPEKQGPEKKPGKKLQAVKKAANLTGDVISGTIGGVLKVVGTVLLILLVAGMMFACVFAYYVKTCLTPSFDLSL